MQIPPGLAQVVVQARRLAVCEPDGSYDVSDLKSNDRRNSGFSYSLGEFDGNASTFFIHAPNAGRSSCNHCFRI